jgi:ActR/RegA family two-component response regulator
VKNSKQDSQPGKIRLLFVDDEQSIRLTLPAILEMHGFEVSVAASVPEALEIMSHEKFDVLLTDLNIGGPADGFVLVSAMKQIQPHAATFILTGYPDFQTALEALHKQVDDYFTKPADIPKLISTLKERIQSARYLGQASGKRASGVILENSDEIIRRWLKALDEEPRLASIRMSGAERVDRFPLLLHALARQLETGEPNIPAESLHAAAAHGAERARQGYAIPLLAAEMRVLHRIIAEVLQGNLLSMDLSTLIPEALQIGEYLQVFLEESIRAFQGTELAPQVA